jgi:hypothetical protein
MLHGTPASGRYRFEQARFAVVGPSATVLAHLPIPDNACRAAARLVDALDFTLRKV